MKQDHYVFVSNYFDLIKYSPRNNPHEWEEDHEGEIDVHDLYIRRPYDAFVISDSCGNWLFVHLPSSYLASEIIEYIKSTEILFV